MKIILWRNVDLVHFYLHLYVFFSFLLLLLLLLGSLHLKAEVILLSNTKQLPLPATTQHSDLKASSDLKKKKNICHSQYL